jgi:hypothetical protein
VRDPPDTEMAAESPGRTRLRWFRARHELIWLFLIAVAIRAAAAWLNPAIVNDSVSLLRTAERFAHDGLAAALTGSEHPLVPWLVARTPAAWDPETAATVLSVLAGALAVWPLHVLARRACGRHAATAACIVYAALPRSIGVASVPLTSTVLLPLFLSGLSLAVAAGLPSSNRRRLVRLVSAGLVCGLAYLCRPEGLVTAAFAVIAAAALARQGRRWASAGIVAAAFVVVAAPYAIALTHHAGHVEISPKKDIARFVGATDAPLAAVDAPPGGGAVSDTLAALDGALTAPVIALVLVGCVLPGRWRHRRSYLPRVLLLGGAVFSLLLVMRLNAGWGYGGAKHMLPGALLLLPFAGEAFLFLGVFISRVRARRRLAVVLASFLAIPFAVRSLLRPVGEDYADARHLGEAIAEAARAAGSPHVVIGSFAEPLVAYYADRSLRRTGGSASDVPLWGRFGKLLKPGDTDELRSQMASALHAAGAQWLVLDLWRPSSGDSEISGRRLAQRLAADLVAGAPVVSAGAPLTAFPVRQP